MNAFTHQSKGLTAHELAEILQSMPNKPVRLVDYEGMECKITRLVSDTERPLNAERCTILLEVEHI